MGQVWLVCDRREEVSPARRRTRVSMTPLAALRARRQADDVPPATTDDELLAWSETLLATPEQPPAKRTLRMRRRTEPLRAARGESAGTGPITTEELLAEIERRAASVAPRVRLRRVS